jgi:hypothetical protein
MSSNQQDTPNDLFSLLNPASNDAVALLAQAAKNNQNSAGYQDRMYDLWNAILAAYFPLENGYLIARCTALEDQPQETKMLSVSRCEDSEMRVLLYLGFTDSTSNAPFHSACSNALEHYFWDGGGIVVCARVSTINFQFFGYDVPGPVESGCYRRPLRIKHTAGPTYSFDGRQYALDDDDDREKLDVVFRLMRRDVTRRGFTSDGRRISEMSFF